MPNPYVLKCLDCGRPESDHHVFEAPVIPNGCACDPREWGSFIPNACAAYVVDPKRSGGECETCEHLKECHEVAA